MKKYFLLVLLAVPFFSFSQNIPQCDSLVIDCCGIGNDTLSLNVTNPTSVLFSYPGFVLLDAGMDTIAKENVTYFGIGTGPQSHYMNMVAPLVLPFIGFLQLYSDFYDTLRCTFPVSIADTASSVNDLHQLQTVIAFPNPASDYVTIRCNGLIGSAMQFLDLSGRVMIKESTIRDKITLNVSLLSSGIYFMEIISKEQITIRKK